MAEAARVELPEHVTGLEHAKQVEWIEKQIKALQDVIGNNKRNIEQRIRETPIEAPAAVHKANKQLCVTMLKNCEKRLDLIARYQHLKQTLPEADVAAMMVADDVVLTEERDKVATMRQKVHDHFQVEESMFSATSGSSGHTGTSDDSMASAVAQTKPKLESISIPDFAGPAKKYEAWRQLFDMMIHNNAGFNDACKMYYLEEHLKGEAAKAVEHIPRRPLMYKRMLETLDQKYGCSRKTLRQEIRAFAAGAAGRPNNEDDVQYNIRVYDLAKNVWSMLENYDGSIAHVMFASMVECHLLEKCALSWEDTWTRKMDKGNPIPSEELVTTLLAYVNRWNNNRENRGPGKKMQAYHVRQEADKGASGDGDATEGQGANGEVTPDGAGESHETCHATGARPKLPQKKAQPRCTFCDAAHFPDQCGKKMTPRDRLECVRRKKACFKCMKPGHTAPSCGRRDCAKCGKPHHTLMHIDNYSQGENQWRRPEDKEDEGGSYRNKPTYLQNVQQQ